jgi:hypothetical protein
MFFVTPHVDMEAGRNPQTGEQIQVPAGTVVKFREFYVDKLTGQTLATSEETHALVPPTTSTSP